MKNGYQAVTVYALQLNNSKFFIGYTTNIDKTVKKQKNDNGNAWVTLHGVKKLLEQQKLVNVTKENVTDTVHNMTRKYMELHGIKNVRSSFFNVCDTKKHLEMVENRYYQEANGHIIDMHKKLSGNWYLYCLLLEKERYYVGISKNPYRRFLEHRKKEKRGALYTKAYPPKKILFIQDLGITNEFDYVKMETQATLNVMQKVGCHRVRGGDICFLEDKTQYDHWRSMLNNNKNKYSFPKEWLNYNFFDFLNSKKEYKITKIQDIL
ncbi:TPA: hypothetical protein IUZ33_003015 [Enterococcus faecalis]|nr:hypothetical protein [Enterococcus faecalis]